MKEITKIKIEEREMNDNQDIINEIEKMTEEEKKTITITLIIFNILKLKKEVEELKQKIKAYETKQDI